MGYQPIGQVTTVEKGFTLWPVKCSVTGERIPMFTRAVRKSVSYPIRDELHTDISWISLKGYTFEVLKGDHK